MANFHLTDPDWQAKREKVKPYLGTDSDQNIGKRFGMSKAVIQVMRSKAGIPPHHKRGPKKHSDAEHLEALERGYPSITVARLWDENRDIQQLLAGWKRCA